MKSNGIQKKPWWKHVWLLSILGAFIALQLVMTAVWAAAAASMLASRNPSTGDTGDSYSYAPAITFNSRWIAFHSLAQNLDPFNPDTDSYWDIFLFDRDSGGDGTLDDVVWTESITHGSNGNSQYPVLARNKSIAAADQGRYVVFQSSASTFGAYNWVSPHITESDPGPYNDIFIFDNNAFSNAGGIFAVSVPLLDGTTTDAASGSPGRIAFSSDNPVHPGADIYLPTANTPYVVFESLASNLINGAYIQYSGSSWSTATLATTSTLNAVFRISGSTHFWFGGEGGALVRYDGSSWADFSGATTSTLRGLAFSSTTYGFAVGDGGVILRWNGSAWSSVTSPTTSTLYGVTLISNSDGWAVGDGGVILRWDGSAWSSITSPTTSTLRSVDNISTSSVFAVGESGTIVKWNGNAWSTVSHGLTTETLNDVSRVPLANRMWVVGDNGTFLLINYVPPNNYTYTKFDPDIATTERLNGVSMVDSSGGWAVGDAGTLYHYYNGTSGTKWYKETSPTVEDLYSIAVQNSTNAWAVGTGGTNDKQHIYVRDVWRDIQNDPTPSSNILLTRNANNEMSNGDSTHPVISSSGRFLAFVSYATNLVSGFSGVDGTRPQVYLLDRDFDNGTPDGTYDEFATPNGVKLYLISRNLVGAGTAGNGDSWSPDIVELDISEPADGVPDIVRVVFSSSANNLLLPYADSNDFRDIFMTEVTLSTQTQNIQRMSISSDEQEGNDLSTAPSISGDGNVISFTSYATNLVAFDNNFDCWQTINGEPTRINCPDIFAHEILHDVTWRASLTSQGRPAGSDSGSSRLDGNGRYATFTTRAQLTTDGSQGVYHQIYVRDQGIPAGNPIIMPSSWEFPDTAPDATSSQTFTLEFLGPLTIDNGSTALISIDNTTHFTLVDTADGSQCSGQSFAEGQTCTFDIVYHPAEEDLGEQQTAIITIPVSDVRKNLYVAVIGNCRIVYFMPLITGGN